MRRLFIRKIKRPILKFVMQFLSKNMSKNVNVNGFSKVNSKTTFGENIHFNGMVVKGHGNVHFGNNFHSGKRCKIITDFHNYEGNSIPYDRTIISKDVKVGDNVWFGDEVLVLGGVTIEEGAIIQARSVVTSNIGYCEIAGGHPAKTFKTRDIEHYEELRRLKRFH